MVSGGGGGGGDLPQETRGRLASPPEAKAFSLAQPHAQASDTASRPRSPVPGRRLTPRHRRGPAVCPSMPRTAWPFPLGLCQASANLCFQEAVTVALRLGPCVALAASAQVSAGAPLSGVTCLPISGWQFAWLLQFSGGPRKVTDFPWVWPFFLEGQGWRHVAGGSRWRLMPCDPRRETGSRAGASPAPPRPPFTEPIDEAFVRADLGPGACAGVNATFSRPQGPSHATLHGVYPCTCGPPGTWGSKAAANFAKSNAARSQGRRGIPRCAPGDSKAPQSHRGYH